MSRPSSAAPPTSDTINRARQVTIGAEVSLALTALKRAVAAGREVRDDVKLELVVDDLNVIADDLELVAGDLQEMAR